ncbi:hypothetical protein NIES2104_61650 [Leptolyngbya sp. NIES-2104]|nr:hypothetical protein NIES2104_61650 [Leptolyngbya sp. NIES-2104]
MRSRNSIFQNKLEQLESAEHNGLESTHSRILLLIQSWMMRRLRQDSRSHSLSYLAETALLCAG